MKIAKALYLLCMICLVAGALTPLAALADNNNTPLYTGSVYDGWSKPLGMYASQITFHISNGSDYVNVSISGPDYPSADNVLIPPGQAYYFYNALRIYVYSVSSNSSQPSERTAQVDISQPSTSSGTSSTTTTGTQLTCVTPGQTALGGDTVTFPITIQNNNGVDKTYTLTANGGGRDWSSSFQYQTRSIYQIYVPSAGTQTVNLVVNTAYDSPIGAQTVTVSTGDASLGLSVDVTSINQSANVNVPISSMIANIGDKAYYDIGIQNLQSQQNDYKLTVTGLPANWYYQFSDSKTSTNQMAEIVVPAMSTTNFVLQILPPASVTVGDYNFTAVITTPDNVTISHPLTLKLNSGTSMTVNYDKLQYTSSPGQTFTIPVYVTNSGKGGALTNVYPDITAPSGWIVSSSPN